MADILRTLAKTRPRRGGRSFRPAYWPANSAGGAASGWPASRTRWF